MPKATEALRYYIESKGQDLNILQAQSVCIANKLRSSD